MEYPPTLIIINYITKTQSIKNNKAAATEFRVVQIGIRRWFFIGKI